MEDFNYVLLCMHDIGEHKSIAKAHVFVRTAGSRPGRLHGREHCPCCLAGGRFMVAQAE